jgi:hypothetical protein
MTEKILSEDEVENLIKKRIQNLVNEDRLHHKAFEIGEYFYKLKINTGHGNFENLIKKEYPYISKRSVQRYMTIYKRKLKND